MNSGILAQLLPGLSFGAPLILFGLLLLPLIWWLLRATPPAARRVIFPPLRLLLGLKDSEVTPLRTPWWLLLLRVVAAMLLIVGLAEPMLGSPPSAAQNGPLVLFVDNGWPAAHAWDARKTLIDEEIDAALRTGRAVAIVPTSEQAHEVSLLDSGAAERIARGLKPVPYIPDRLGAARRVVRTSFPERPEILWLSDGLEDYARATADLLAQAGRLRIFADADANMPLGLKPPDEESNGFVTTIIRPDISAGREGIVEALGARDEKLGEEHFSIATGHDSASVKIMLPLEMRNEAMRLQIEGQNSAGSTTLLDQGATHSVGIVSASASESTQPLLSDVFYLERALAPYAEVRKGTISSLLSGNPSVLVLTDIGRIAGADYSRVVNFVDSGGVLIRFAGERMTGDVDDLVPVKLRTGGRYLAGALEWSEPQHLATFPDASPFSGLSIPPDVTVSRQVLAEPSVELADRTWARLQDGTPLVTALEKGKGLIVLLHVTAGPAWSTLPFSGLYVRMLRRLLALSGGARAGTPASTPSLPALRALDGFGNLEGPPADVAPIRAGEFGKAVASRAHPPGLYGPEGSAYALNAVTKETVLTPFGDIGRHIETYTGARATMLGPLLMATAFVLLLIDAMIALALRGLLSVPRRLFARAALTGVALLAMQATGARADDSFNETAALDTRLAYVVTGLPDMDEISREGLTGLGQALKDRTSYEPETCVGVNIERDDLSFFPLLYWPMDPREKDLSPQAISKIADYMRNGGTILFDTRDLTLGSVRGPQSPGEQTLRRLLQKLDIPPLELVPSDHVLTKAFYLIQDFPGRWDGGKVWVQALPPPDPNSEAPARGGDGVSPVIIGGNDWAAAWAIDAQGRPVVDVAPGGEHQREMALRFGINVVMYALTGNYKADVVHWPALLERLGK